MAKSALMPKLRFPEFRNESHTKARSHEEEGAMAMSSESKFLRVFV